MSKKLSRSSLNIKITTGLILLSIGVLFLVLFALIFTFECVSMDLKPRCQLGFCLEAENLTIQSLENGIETLKDAHVEALVVKYDDYKDKNNSKLIKLANSHGIAFLFKVDFSSGVVTFDIPNNGYIIQGTNLTSIKNYDWDAIKVNKKLLEEISCVHICLFVEIVLQVDLEVARSEEFLKDHDLCGIYLENSLQEPLESNFASEANFLESHIVSFPTPVNDFTSYRPYTILKSGLSIAYSDIGKVKENSDFMVEAFKMRSKILRSTSIDHFNRVDISSGNVFVMRYNDTRTGGTYDVVLLTERESSNVTVSEIKSDVQSWSYLLGPSDLRGRKFDKKQISQVIERKPDSEFCVVALY